MVDRPCPWCGGPTVAHDSAHCDLRGCIACVAERCGATSCGNLPHDGALILKAEAAQEVPHYDPPYTHEHRWIGVGGGPSYRHRLCRGCGMLAVDLIDSTRDDLPDEQRRTFSAFFAADMGAIEWPTPKGKANAD